MGIAMTLVTTLVYPVFGNDESGKEIATKIIIAPDSFKGSLTAKEAAKAIERGLRCSPLEAEMVLVPMADGGEDTVQALVDATGGRMIRAQVTGPLGQIVTASYGILGDGRTAAIEMAAVRPSPKMP